MEKIRKFSLQEDELFEHSDDIWKVDNLDNYVDDHIHSRRFTAVESKILLQLKKPQRKRL